MDVEFTARQVRVSKTLKAGATEGIERIALVLGKVTVASVTFRAERHMQIVEIALQSRNHKIVAAGEAGTQTAALREALEHAELQAQRFRDRIRTRKRQAKVDETAEPAAKKRTPRKASTEKAEAEKPAIARNPGHKTKAAITVHSFPGKPKVVEPHILSAAEALAIRPMTIEEAVKEAEFRDKDLLVFRNLAGDMYVLHRRRDGQMELVEIP
jgi:putative sigma-54 modulation protein